MSPYEEFTHKAIRCLNAALYLGYQLPANTEADVLAERLRDLVPQLYWLENSGLDLRAFAGHYRHPPKPLFGMCSESYHGLAIGLSGWFDMMLLMAVHFGEGEVTFPVPGPTADLPDKIKTNWQAMSGVLQWIEAARNRINLAWLHTRLRDESVRAERAARSRAFRKRPVAVGATASEPAKPTTTETKPRGKKAELQQSAISDANAKQKRNAGTAAKVPPSRTNAYVAYQWALSLCKSDATYENIYQYLREHDLPRELGDWKVPKKFKTWQRYVQGAKNSRGESGPRLQEIQKAYSKSVVGANAVEPVQQDADNDLPKIPLSPEHERANRLERLSELASDIYALQADGKTLNPEKMQDYWNETVAILRWLAVDAKTVRQLHSSGDAKGLAELANKLQAE